ncbi:hypothetical protein BY458DRAFT_552659 [Sporodiniella umbellata]|nr:hypothetical protein BY458DRAFT_552659 [Sporodiniella umbellata]
MSSALADGTKPNSSEASSAKKKGKSRSSQKPESSKKKEQPAIESKKNAKPKDSTLHSKKKAVEATGNHRKPGEGSSKKNRSRNRIAAPSDFKSPFEDESKFIVIETAIDPIHQIKSASGSSTREHIEHGYERYIRLIGRSIEKFKTVTLVGMESGIVDVVSIVAMLYDRQICVHQEVETFTTIQMNGKKASGIQVALCLYAFPI